MPVTFDNATFGTRSQRFVMPSDGEKLASIGARLVREVARVGWDVPGIDVEFRSFERDGEVIRVLSSISGTTKSGPFRFGFETRSYPELECTLRHAAVPPGIDLNRIDGGFQARVFVGTSWKSQGRVYLEAFKTNSKLDGEDRTYLTYEGGETLHADDDLGREYAPKENEPQTLVTAKVVDMIDRFTRGDLLRNLTAMPDAPGHDDVTSEGDANLRRFAAVETIPVPADFPVLHAWVSIDDARRIMGRDDEDVDPSEGRHILSGTGKRLIPMGLDHQGLALHPRVSDGFCYASADPSIKAGHVRSDVRAEALPVEITLTSLNDIFVVDNGVYEAARQAALVIAESHGRDFLTDEEDEAALLCMARTMVPATDYRGGFELPTYLIGRQIFDDEARLMTGRIEIEIDEKRITGRLIEDRSDVVMTLFEFGKSERCRHKARRLTLDFAQTLGCGATVRHLEIASGPTP